MVSILLGVYGAYWAFRIRGALQVRIYRGQAMGIGMVSLAFASILIMLGPVQGLFPSVPKILFLLPSLWVTSLVLFYWIDFSVRAGRRTDPLFRDTGRWSKIRRVLWAYELTLVGAGVVILLVSLATTGGLAPPNSAPIYQLAGFLIVFGPIFGGVVSGAVLLPLVRSRSADEAMKAHLRWFSTFFLLLLVGLAGSILLGSLFGVDGGYVLGPISVGWAYCLYRGAKSLAPLNRLDPGGARSLAPVNKIPADR
ncbi:MAG: hypothetical protein JRN08_08580 [Nitrososphaerota archaeon]|nr:hypothetical protein [Nitrososphaerota archaeon]